MTLLTNKEIKLLNLIYFKLKGKHEEYNELSKFLQDFFRLKEDLAFELAYLYDKNFDQAEGEEGMGDFSKVTDPKRMTYEEYREKVPWQVKAVMKVVGDDDPDAFDFDDDNVVTYMGDGEEYTVFEDESEIRSLAEDNDLSYVCDESDPIEDYIYMTDTDRRIFSSAESDYEVDEMDDDAVIERMNLEDTLDELESYEEKKEKLKELEEELENEEDEEEIDRIQSEIDEITEEISNIGTTQSREEIIDAAREDLKSEIYDFIYGELDDPVRYFIHDRGVYGDASELLENGPVQYDCDKYVEDYLDEASIDSLANLAGYGGGYEEVGIENPNGEINYVHVLWR